jgi:putative membrane protein
MHMKPMLAIGAATLFAVVTAGAVQAQSIDNMTLSQAREPMTAPPSSASKGATGSDTMRSSQTKAPTQAQKKFITEAIQGDLAEVKMGQLAQQKGQSQQVKQFGQMLEKDHGMHEQKAKQMAESMGVTPPSQPSSDHQAIYNKLSKLSGAEFDKEFAQAMVKDHREDISDFEKEAKNSGTLGNFAQQTLPTLQKHLQMAQQIMQETTGSGRR